MQTELQVIHSTALLTPAPAHSHLPSRHTRAQRFLLVLFFQPPSSSYQEAGRCLDFPFCLLSSSLVLSTMFKYLRLDLLPDIVSVLSSCLHRNICPLDFTPAVEFCAVFFVFSTHVKFLRCSYISICPSCATVLPGK